MELATAACNHVISRWTGVGPEAAAEAARKCAELLDYRRNQHWWDQDRIRDRGEAAMGKNTTFLQLALMGTRLQAAVVGAKTGAVFVRRRAAVEKDLLLPLEIFTQDSVGDDEN